MEEIESEDLEALMDELGWAEEYEDYLLEVSEDGK